MTVETRRIISATILCCCACAVFAAAPTRMDAAVPAAAPMRVDAVVPDTSVITTVGPWTITVRDLLDSYEFGPAFVKRGSQPLFRHLEYMISERLLAASALDQRSDTTAFVRERLAGLEEDAAVDQLYKDDVLSNIVLTRGEIEEGARKSAITVRLRWIVTRTQRKADSLHAAFKAGKRIDPALFARNDSGAVAGIESTLLALERDNPAAARQIAGLHALELSAPVKGPDGYYLFVVDDIVTTPIATETSLDAARLEARTVLTAAKADAIAGAYVQRLMKQNAPVIKAEGYNIIRAFLADKGLTRGKKTEWDIPSTFMTEAGPVPITESGKFVHKTLVTYGGKRLTVGDYIRWFDIRQFQLKTSSLEAFNRSVKQTVWKMTQDKLLSEAAYARGLNRRDTVRHETNKWKAKLLYLAARSSVMRSQDPQAALVRRLEQLKKSYTVTIDMETLAVLQASLGIERQPVEIFYYKPGGTFPRVAFPTIDPAWQDF